MYCIDILINITRRNYIKRDFTDDMKEQLLDAVDEEHPLPMMGKPSLMGEVLSEQEIELIYTPWYKTYIWEQTMINLNLAAKQKIETVWEDVYSVSSKYKQKFDMNRELADNIVKKLNIISDILSSGTGSGDYGKLEQLP